MIQAEHTPIGGMILLRENLIRDTRGSFFKVFHSHRLGELGLRDDFVESYVTVSNARVIRGLHFQLPPSDYAKIVWCLSGSVFDVALDLRENSPTYKQHFGTRLDGERGDGVYLDTGLAHGFCVIDAPATLLYLTTSVHDPDNDSGIRWDSCGIPWPIDSPVISERDATLAPLEDFVSPWTL